MPRPALSPALFALALLGGCAAVPAAPPVSPAAPAEAVPTGAAYFALGTEPFWSVEITDARIAYNDAGGRDLRIANPRPGDVGGTYATERLTVVIAPGPCSDGMSDRRYADTVRVTIDGERLSGCGGRVVPPQSIEGTRWRILSIDGAQPAADRPAELAFVEGRLSGSAGCNRLSASYASDGARLTAGPVAATRMLCAPETMSLETRLIALLRQSLAMGFDPRGRLTLTGNGGATVVLLRAE